MSGMVLRSKRIKLDTSLHDDLHVAIKESNLEHVKHLISLGVKPCVVKSNENCFILALKNKNPVYLRTLLKHRPKGVNACNLKGESLLMLDIKFNKSKHFFELINHGANVDHYSRYHNGHGVKSHYTALHYACMDKKTPYEVIETLIEEGAEVNACIIVERDAPLFENLECDEGFIDYKDFDTPLICILKNYDDNSYKKIRLLIKSGAKVNKSNQLDFTPLMYAVKNIHGDSCNIIKVIKLLLKKKADTRAYNTNKEDAISLLLPSAQSVNEFTLRNYVPVLDILYKAKCQLFRKGACNLSALEKLIVRYERNESLKNIIQYFFTLALTSRTFRINKKEQTNPVEALFCTIIRDSKLISGFFPQIISHSSVKIRFCMFANLKFHFKWSNNRKTKEEFGQYSILTAIALKFPLRDIKPWLKFFIENGYYSYFVDEPLLYIIIRRFINSDESIDDVFDLIDFLKDEGFPLLRGEARYDITCCLPDCIWFSALNGNINYLKRFLRYWDKPALSLVTEIHPWLSYYIHTWFEKYQLNKIIEILPFLIEVDGPLAPGTESYENMMDYIQKCETKYRRGYVLTPIQENTRRSTRELYATIGRRLRTLHDSPPKLQVMCRNIIRSTVNVHPNKLPDTLKSLVPHGLREFISLENY